MEPMGSGQFSFAGFAVWVHCAFYRVMQVLVAEVLHQAAGCCRMIEQLSHWMLSHLQAGSLVTLVALWR